MSVLTRVAAPAAWLLDRSASLVFRLLGRAEEREERVTEGDVRAVIADAERTGGIDTAAGAEAARAAVLRSPHSRLPAGDGSQDAAVGVVRARELLSAMLDGRTPDLRSLVRPAPIVPDTADALDVLAILREAEVPMALVHDEHGHFEGVVTPTDLTGAIVGAFRSDAGPD